jgi:hypothetical protein
MEGLFLLFYPLAFVLLFFSLDFSLRKILKTKYRKLYTIIGFFIAAPFLIVLLGFAAIQLLPFPKD